MTDSDPHDSDSRSGSTHDPSWSAPAADIIAVVGELLRREEPGVLATVTRVEGSAYRRPGAKMVLPAADSDVGHVTAGCLEDEIRAIAEDVLAAGEPRLETFDLTGGDDVWGLGIGCNGVIDLLLEPIDDSYRPVVEAVEAGESIGLLTVLEDGPIGARAYYEPATETLRPADAFPAGLVDALADDAAAALAADRSETVRRDDTTVFVDAIAPPPELLVVGSGNDVRPITALAARVGYDVTVVGYRGTTATADRFPAATRVHATSPRQLLDVVTPDDATYAVVATHNFIDDRLTVETLLETPVPYIGVMGPHKRFAEMREAFADEDRPLTTAELDRIYTPIGLDLGGGAPREIALSIVSEVQAVRHGREPGHLTDRDGPIHDRGRTRDGDTR